jgi:dihydrofolate reductase
MIISIIASISNNYCIGANNTLLWNQLEDLKRFKFITSDHVVIMGQRTYESLPFKPLKNRTNIVISNDHNVRYDGCVMAYSIDEAIQKAKYWASDKDEVFIIGGGSIYKQFLPLANKLYITRIDVDIEGDVYFPFIDEKEWFKCFKAYHPKNNKNQYDYTFEIYRKL